MQGLPGQPAGSCALHRLLPCLPAPAAAPDLAAATAAAPDLAAATAAAPCAVFLSVGSPPCSIHTIDVNDPAVGFGSEDPTKDATQHRLWKKYVTFHKVRPNSLCTSTNGLGSRCYLLLSCWGAQPYQSWLSPATTTGWLSHPPPRAGIFYR